MSDDNQTAKSYEIPVKCADEKEKDKLIAKTYLRPSVVAAGAIKGQYHQDNQVTINALVGELSEQIDKVHQGDMKRVESMLVAQAHALNSLFGELVTRSRLNMGEYFNAADKYMRLALKAQGQCRTTLETLANIKNPQPYIQNNKAQYQQVNNGSLSTGGNYDTSTRTGAHARENSKTSNELLEDKSNENTWVDIGAQSLASGDDKELATVAI